MKVAILNPGPSLSMYDDGGGDLRGGYDLVVGVNRAATKHRCDVWLACDVPAVQNFGKDVIGSPLLVTGTESWGVIDANHWWRGEMIAQDKYLSVMDHGNGWTTFSCTSAIAYAAFRGATEIDLYGADWSGEKDFDGVAAGENRSESRWDFERGMVLNVIFPILRARGITCRRIMRPTYVSFYTPIYEAEAMELVKTLDAFGLRHDVRRLESQGSWVRNCARKADFLLELRHERPGMPLVWADSDARLRRLPELFESGRMDCEFAAHWLGDELLSGTMYWGCGASADRLLKVWAERCRKNPDVWDQVSLQQVISEAARWEETDARAPRVERLPASYTAIFDAGMCRPDEIVFEHMQASRRLREAV